MIPTYNEEWTADVVGRMHRARIKNSTLAEECGYTAAYLSTVLNGGKQFESEEAKQKTKDRIFAALEALEALEASTRDAAENDAPGAN